jgi:hypothetical protein
MASKCTGKERRKCRGRMKIKSILENVEYMEADVIMYSGDGLRSGLLYKCAIWLYG